MASAATLTSSGGSDLGFVSDWNRESYWSVQPFSPQWVRLDFGTTRVETNGVELWPGAMNAFFPRRYVLTASDGAEEAVVVSKRGQSTAAFTPLRHLNYFATAYRRSVKLEVAESAGDKLYLAGLVPLVCRLTPPPAITYTPASLTLTMNVDAVSLAPSVDGYTHCSIAPALPAGLALDPDTCVIEGTATAALAVTQFTVTSRMEATHVGTLTLAVTDCGGNTVVVTRVHGAGSAREAFTLAHGEEVLLEEPFSGSQQDGATQVTRLCTSHAQLTLTLASQQSRWSTGSRVEVATESCGHVEPLLRARFDTAAGTPTQFTLQVASAKKCESAWHYKMGEAPDDWLTQDVAAWPEAVRGGFPASPNQLQLYRASFEVADRGQVAGLRLLLRFRFGLLVFLNGHEVYREGVVGDLSAASVSTSAREAADYYEITVPARLLQDPAQEGELILQEGTNALAVAVVGTGAAQTTADFDGDVRVLYDSSRVLHATVSSDDVPNVANGVDGDSATEVGGAGCTNSIVFDMGARREWVSAVVLQSSVAERGKEPSHLVVEARDAEGAWEPLGEFIDLQWWAQGQVKEVALTNRRAWRFYRLRDLFASSSACAWSLARIDLRVFDLVTPAAALAYPTADVTAFLNIEFAEIYPTAMAFMQVSVAPPLPAGIHVDSTSGVIHGTPTAFAERRAYTVTATQRTGGRSSAALGFAVTQCSGGQSLITLTLRSDSDPAAMRFALYRGRGTMGVQLSAVEALPTASALFYYDFCLVHNIYSLVFQGPNAGWASEAGFMLTVDVGALRFELGQLPRRTGSSTQPASLTTAFSSYLPFQVGYTLWRVWADYDIPADWAQAAFDDAQWPERKAAELGTAEPITVFVRRAFELSGLEEYNVLNVRVRYGGGLRAFFNGREVARFNLPALVQEATYASAAHDPGAFSVFHVVLANQGAVEGRNAVGFELHRAEGQEEAALEFDATGVFGVEDCAVVRDSYQRVAGSAPAEGHWTSLLDGSPLTTVQLENQEGSFVEWSLENAVPSQFNAYALYAFDTLQGLAYSVYGQRADAAEWLTLDEQPSTLVYAHARFTRAATLGIIGFQSLRFVLDAHLAAEPRFAAFVTLNCRVQGDVCPAVGEYPAVAEGQVSPAFCPEGYEGYAYRLCRNGRLGEVQTDRCAMRPPEDLSYGLDTIVFVKGVQNASPAPTYEYIVQEFYLDDHVVLPPGLALDPASGRIAGVPTEVMNATEYTVYGKNARGATSVTIRISIREAFCMADGVFPETLAGNTATYACSAEGAYLGTLKRACVLGTKDGEWKRQRGLCMHVAVLIVLVILVLLVIGFTIWFCSILRRKGRRAMKAVPGAKKGLKKGAATQGKRAMKV